MSAALPCGTGLRAGISLAAAGDMALSRQDLLPHRSRFIEGLGVPRERVFAVRQVHSRRVIVVESQDPSLLVRAEADGMVTRRRDILLSVTVADCLPILLRDRATGAFGLVHSGWKGTGIVVDALHVMESTWGTRPADVEVTIGPGIGACCYAVPAERVARFAQEFGASSVVRPGGAARPGDAARPDGAAQPAGDAQPRLDLRAANVALLQAAGVDDITVVSDCTGCTSALGSFRRQGPQKYTLMLAYVGAASERGR